MTDVKRDPEGVERRHLLPLARPDGERVLEVGCGSGRLTWQYAGAASNVQGIDPHGDSIAEAVRKRPEALSRKVDFSQADAEALPFGNQTFDLAILAWSL